MTTATRDDVLSAFPGLQDHAIVELLEMKTTVDDLEAVLGMLTSDDKDLIEIRRREGGQIHRLLNILSRAGVDVVQGRER